MVIYVSYSPLMYLFVDLLNNIPTNNQRNVSFGVDGFFWQSAYYVLFVTNKHHEKSNTQD